jgi:hypothetical protein
VQAAGQRARGGSSSSRGRHLGRHGASLDRHSDGRGRGRQRAGQQEGVGRQRTGTTPRRNRGDEERRTRVGVLRRASFFDTRAFFCRTDAEFQHAPSVSIHRGHCASCVASKVTMRPLVLNPPSYYVQVRGLYATGKCRPCKLRSRCNLAVTTDIMGCQIGAWLCSKQELRAETHSTVVTAVTTVNQGKSNAAQTRERAVFTVTTHSTSCAHTETHQERSTQSEGVSATHTLPLATVKRHQQTPTCKHTHCVQDAPT